MLSNAFYYIFFSSTLLVYGIGMDSITVIGDNPRHILLDFIKMLFIVTATSCLTYLTSSNFLFKINLMELYPFIATLFFIVISGMIESVVRITARSTSAEYSVPLLSIIIAVNESHSVAECVLNSCFCVIAYFICVPIVYSFKNSIERTFPSHDFHNLGLIIASIAILILVLYVGDVSWIRNFY